MIDRDQLEDLASRGITAVQVMDGDDFADVAEQVLHVEPELIAEYVQMVMAGWESIRDAKGSLYAALLLGREIGLHQALEALRETA